MPQFLKMETPGWSRSMSDTFSATIMEDVPTCRNWLVCTPTRYITWNCPVCKRKVVNILFAGVGPSTSIVIWRVLTREVSACPQGPRQRERPPLQNRAIECHQRHSEAAAPEVSGQAEQVASPNTDETGRSPHPPEPGNGPCIRSSGVSGVRATTSTLLYKYITIHI